MVICRIVQRAGAYVTMSEERRVQNFFKLLSGMPLDKEFQFSEVGFHFFLFGTCEHSKHRLSPYKKRVAWKNLKSKDLFEIKSEIKIKNIL